jgi:hypothetical protein
MKVERMNRVRVADFLPKICGEISRGTVGVRMMLCTFDFNPAML